MTDVITDRIAGVTAAVAIKAPCLTVATTPITLAGLQTVNGVTLAEDDRVLVTGQADTTENGIYPASNGAWSRALDFDGARDAVRGTLVPVCTSGSNTASIYELVATDPVRIGSSALSFELRYFSNSTDSTALSYAQTVPEDAATSKPTNYTFYRPPGDLRRYGSVGDGVTDNTAAIGYAISQCAQRGDPVYVPRGIWLSQQQSLASGITIYGDDWNSCLKLMSAANNYLFANTNANVYVDDVTIRNLHIDGNKANNTSGGGIGLNGRRCKVINVYVHDTVNLGMYHGAPGAGATNTPLAGHGGFYQCTLMNCGKSNSWGAMALTHGSDWEMIGNQIWCTDAQSDYGIDVEPNAGNLIDGVVIVGNTIRGGNIQVDAANLGGVLTASGIVVAKNKVDARGRYTPTDKTAMAPLWFRQISDFEISGNVCQGHDTRTMGGLVFEDSGMTTTYSARCGSVVSNIFRSAVAATRSGYCRVINDVTFQANTWEVSSSSNALEFGGACLNVRGTGNIINNAGAGTAISIGAGTNIVFDASNSLTGTVSVAGTACKVARDDLYGSKTWDIGSTLTQASASTQVTVTGAARTKGQYVKSIVLTTLPQGWTLTGGITNTDEVTAVATNVSGSTGDPPSGTLTVTLGRETLS